MKLRLLTLACLTSLAACQPSTSSQSEAPSPAETAHATVQPCPPTVAGYRFLPDSEEVPVAYHLRADRIYVGKNGQLRRRAVLEFLEGGADTVLASVEESMLRNGYVARPRRTPANGNIVAPYARKGGVNMTVIVSPNAGENPSHPDAKGTLTYDYPFGPVKASQADGAL